MCSSKGHIFFMKFDIFHIFVMFSTFDISQGWQCSPKIKKIKNSKNSKNYIHNSSITFVKNMQIFHKPADNKRQTYICIKRLQCCGYNFVGQNRRTFYPLISRRIFCKYCKFYIMLISCLGFKILIVRTLVLL